MKTFLVLMIILIIVLYFLPSLLARDDEHFKLIFFLNIVLGWTAFAWVVLLGWALFYKNPRNPKGEDMERALLNLIRRYGGRITPVEIAAETRLNLKQAREELEKFREAGESELQVTENGNLIYVFPGFLTDSEKKSSKSPLEI